MRMTFEFSTLFEPLALAILLGLSLIVFGVLSVVFIYHWREYGMDTRIIKTAPLVYLPISIVLAAAALISYMLLF